MNNIIQVRLNVRKGFFGVPQNDKRAGIITRKKTYLFKRISPKFYGFRLWF